LISSDKHELEQLKPFDLFIYINKKLSYKFPVGKVLEYKNIMNRSNARQIFDYILSNDIKSRLQSYLNVFIRVKHCSIPQPNNPFFVYYVAQTLCNELSSVKNELITFLLQNRINPNKYSKFFDNTITFLYNLYENKINEMDEIKVDYNLSSFKTLIMAPYDENTFLDPEKIIKILKPYSDNDVSKYKDIIQLILTQESVFKIKEKDKKYYLKIFKNLLQVDSLIMKNNNANTNTLYKTCQDIFSKDKQNIELKLHKNEDGCQDSKQYLIYYDKILQKIS
jgi:hypothetical protein